MTVLRIDLDFSDREHAIIAISLVAGFVVGMWAGVLSIPHEALAVPKTYTEEQVRIAYNPVTSGHVVATFVLPLTALFYAYGLPFGESSEDTDESEGSE
jgi:hypothetical protein